MKLRVKTIFTFLLAFILLNTTAYAEKFVRQNNFLNEKNRFERVAQIKKFQAIANLEVDGVLGKRTKDLLYNPDLIVYDLIEKPPTKGYWIAVNKSRRTLTLYHGNITVNKYAVALGAKDTPTPSAKGKINSKVVNPAWGGMNGKYEPRAADDPLNPLGERWLGLNLGPKLRGYGIHGTILPGQIGSYVSNGCIRMFNYDIETEVFPKVGKGTPVWIGTNEELASWGVRQIVDKQKGGAIIQESTPDPVIELLPEEKEKVEVVNFNTLVGND
ncbi:MAG: L,D-transpeptidase family protein [Tissierellia bacterium]|nr:L,D-transpeptidase family protein [Tissierellia bacterium]